MAQRNYHRFLLHIAGLCLTGALAVVSITVLTDPYGVFGTPRIAGLNALKPDSGNDRLIKAAAIRREHYTGLILGTSQAQYGLNPESPSLLKTGHRFYNLGLVAATPYQLLRYMEGANRHGQVRTVIVLIDVLMFNEKVERQVGAFGFAEERIPVARSGAAQGFLAHLWDVPEVAFTFDALKLGLKSALKQTVENEWLTPTGLRAPANIRRDLWGEGGPHKAFHESEKRYCEWFQGFTLTPTHKAPTALDEFEDILDYCAEHEIAVRILFAPSHARYFQLLDAMGLMDDVEQLKRKLVRLIHSHATTRNRVVPPIWDFSSANEITSEAVPAPASSPAEMQWYYDAVHFTPKLGDVILAESTQEAGNKGEISMEQLTLESVEGALKRIRASHETYAASHPDEVQQLKRLVAELSQESSRPRNKQPGASDAP